MFSNEVHELIYCLGFGDVEPDRCFADVKIDLAGCSAHVTEIRVGHLTGAVDDAAHDGDFHAFEVLGARLDSSGNGLQVEKGATAGRAGDVVGFKGAEPGCLKDVIGKTQGLARAGLAAN